MFRKVDMSPPEQDAYEAGARDMRERAADLIAAIGNVRSGPLDTSQVKDMVKAEMIDLVRHVTGEGADAIRALPLRAEDKS